LTVQEKWDGNKATHNLVKWATDKDGKVAKGSIDKFFGKVDGDGQKLYDYHYPLGDVGPDDKEPHYDFDGLDAAFGAAMGDMGAEKDTTLAKKIAKIAKSNFGKDKLTKGMKDILGIKDKEARVAHKPGEVYSERISEVVQMGGKVIYQDAYIVEIPCTPVTEGVFSPGNDPYPTLRTFDEFGKYFDRLDGIAITDGHTEHGQLDPDDRWMGKLMTSRADPVKRTIRSIARFTIADITPNELAKVTSGQPFDGSLEYNCNFVDEIGEWNGKQYYRKAVGPYVFYNYAVVPEGACSSANDGCGFNVESGKSAVATATLVRDKVEYPNVISECNCSKKKPEESNMAIDEEAAKKAAKEKATLEAENASLKEQVAKQKTESEAFAARLTAVETETKKTQTELIAERAKNEAAKDKAAMEAFAEGLKPAIAADVAKIWTEVKAVGESMYLKLHPEAKITETEKRIVTGATHGVSEAKISEARSKVKEIMAKKRAAKR
jgi:hypothetical protein